MNESPWPDWLTTAHTWFDFFRVALLPHLLTIGGFVLALLILARFFSEKRTPSNIFAWSLLIFFIPYLGVPLYFLFGGRKSRKLVSSKMKIRSMAESTYNIKEKEANEDGNSTPSIWNPKQGVYYGNTFQLLGDGLSSYKALSYEIEQARESIHIMTYIFSNDRVGSAVAEQLIQKAQEGVQVRVLIDALGSMGRIGSLARKFRKAGVEIVRFMPMLPLQTKTSANLRNHRKMCIFDGERAIVGGQNIDDRFMSVEEDSNCFRDFNTLMEGPVVQHFNMIFLSDWCFASKQKPERFLGYFQRKVEARGNNTIRVMSSGPDVTGDPLWEALITLVQECQNELTIVTPYFIPEEVLFRSLIVKAHTGRRIRLIVPEKSNHKMTDFARNYYLRQLSKAGVEILLYTAGMIHAKLLIVDDEIAMVGSANIDMRSLFVNFEVGVFHTSEKPISDLKDWLETILPRCVHFQDTEVSKGRSSRHLLEDFAHLLGPLL